jgi:hypothetical protein
MRKYLIGVVLLFSLFCTFSMPIQSEAYFSRSEAMALLDGNGGWWVDTDTGRRVHFDRQTTSIKDSGYINSLGDSLIYFGNRGAQFKMYITYYPDQNKYYARVYYSNGTEWQPFMNCAMRE